MGTRLRLRATVAILVLLVSGCSAQTSTTATTIESGSSLESQKLQWQDCGSGFECAQMLVPLDWTNGGDTYIPIALNRKAGTSALPPLVINPGGPGASGVKFLSGNYANIATATVRSKFQLIGFDPRGVGKSAPVTCSDENLKDEVFYGQSPYEFGSDQDIAYSKDLLERFAKNCQESGFDVAYFNTQQTARDLDLLRQLLGMEQLDYLGFSYGTELGAVYAALFPERVGKFVLDGAIDPQQSEGQNLLSQVHGFDKAFDAYLSNCVGNSGCPFSSDLSKAKQQVLDLMQSIEAKPLATQLERVLTSSAALYGIIAALYSQDSWVYLTQAFGEALAGDGTTMLMLADFYNDRDPAGGYLSNINEAYTAISCADARVSDEEAQLLRDEITSASWLFGKYFSHPELGCVGWPEGKGLVDLDFTTELTSGPLVIGTTGDPATPYEQAVALSELLSGARLISYVGEGHTAFGSNACVDNYVEEYLAGTLSELANLTCR